MARKVNGQNLTASILMKMKYRMAPDRITVPVEAAVVLLPEEELQM